MSVFGLKMGPTLKKIRKYTFCPKTAISAVSNRLLQEAIDCLEWQSIGVAIDFLKRQSIGEAIDCQEGPIDCQVAEKFSLLI